MSDLRQLVDDLSGLTVEDWLAAEFVSLARDTKDLASSLDDTLRHVRLRCDAVRKAA